MRCKFINGQTTSYDASYVSYNSSMFIEIFSLKFFTIIIIDNNNNKKIINLYMHWVILLLRDLMAFIYFRIENSYIVNSYYGFILWV